MVLIAGKTVSNTLVSGGTLEEESPLVGVLTFLGDTPIALLITLLAAILLLRVGGGKDGLQKLLDDSLAPICSIILITGAGGMFGGVLRASGIGDALSDSLASIGVPVIFAAYIALIRNFRRYSWLLMYLFGPLAASSVLLFAVLPFGVRSQHDAGDVEQAHVGPNGWDQALIV